MRVGCLPPSPCAWLFVSLAVRLALWLSYSMPSCLRRLPACQPASLPPLCLLGLPSCMGPATSCCCSFPSPLTKASPPTHPLVHPPTLPSTHPTHPTQHPAPASPHADPLSAEFPPPPRAPPQRLGFTPRQQRRMITCLPWFLEPFGADLLRTCVAFWLGKGMERQDLVRFLMQYPKVGGVGGRAGLGRVSELCFLRTA